MKKNILMSLIALLLAGGALTLTLTWYMSDSKDTEELYRERVLSVNYENTIETAVAQTELYSIIKEHFTSPLKEGTTEKKVALIGYDGCRADVLTQVKEGEGGIGLLMSEGASLKLSYCGGVNYPEENTQATSTGPGWCSILTGKWADETGITANSITKGLEHKTLFTSLTEEGIIDSAAFITRWAGHFVNEDSTYARERVYCMENQLPVTFIKAKNDKDSFAYTIDEIQKPQCADFLFVVYEPTDATGHKLGFSSNSPYYKSAFTACEKLGAQTIRAIRERATYPTEDWLIIITSDHGGYGTGHGHESIQERMTFIVMNKA